MPYRLNPDQLTPERTEAGRLVMALAVTFAVLGSLAGCAVPAVSKPGHFAIGGTIDVPNDFQDLGAKPILGQRCQSDVPDADIAVGVRVLVSNPAGKVIATGKLLPGRLNQGTSAVFADGRCLYPFMIANVPDGYKTYGITAGTDRGIVKYARYDLNDDLDLTAG